MGLRTIAVWLFALVFSHVAWRGQRIVALCGLIMLMGVSEHPDMPKGALGIPGLNPWNLLLGNLLLAWLLNRERRPLFGELSPGVRFALLLFFVVGLWSSVRLMLDPGVLLEKSSLTTLFNDYLLNTVKFTLPGLIAFDECRTERQLRQVLLAIVALYLILAIQVIRWMPVSMVLSSGEELRRASLKFIRNEIGYSRVSMSMLLSGAFWGALALVPMAAGSSRKYLPLLAAGTIFFGQALTGGRMGYATWGAVGIVLCTVRWRKVLPLIPLAALTIVLVMPSVRERMLTGFSSNSNMVVTEEQDQEEFTAGRSIVWPYVIEKIQEAPFGGYGREAMVRTGLYQWLSDEVLGYADFAHPHNAYLQIAFDAGVPAAVAVVLFYLVILRHAFRQFRDRESPIHCAAGGVAAALLLALMIAGMGSQTFYPVDDAVGMWAAIGVMLRTSVDRARAAAA
jgi:O-antigen ligase